MNELRQLLKQDTAQIHSLVESKSAMVQLLNPTLTRSTYTQVLSQLYRVYLPLEASLAAINELDSRVPDLRLRWKTPSLRKDLESLEVSLPDDFCSPPLLHRFGHAMGALYVLEGSSLGAQVLAAALKKRDFVSNENLNFFSHYGTQVGVHWQNFLKALNQVPKMDYLDAREGARLTFRHFFRHLGEGHKGS